MAIKTKVEEQDHETAYEEISLFATADDLVKNIQLNETMIHIEKDNEKETETNE